jgi:hypothetical protein
MVAHSTLIWVANAMRPLKVQELQVALAVERGTRQLDKENLMKIEIILSVCAGLVIVDKQLNEVRLVHQTTQEYLDNIQAKQFPDAHTKIARTLLTFLSFDGFQDLIKTWSWIFSLAGLPPLYEYSQYSLVHAAAQPDTDIIHILLEKGANINASGGKYGSALQAAAYMGHAEIVRILLEKGANVDATGGEYGTALEIAAKQHHNGIVHMLLEMGASR